MLELQNKYTKKEFAQFLKQAREVSGLNEQQFCERVGIGYTAITDWERGKTLPDDPYAVAYEINEALKGGFNHVRNNTGKAYGHGREVS